MIKLTVLILFVRSKMTGSKRPRIDFYEIGIPEGAILKCKKINDEVRVAGPRTVTLRGEEMSLTRATLIILNVDSTPSIAHQWLYEGECLRDVYDRTHPKKGKSKTIRRQRMNKLLEKKFWETATIKDVEKALNEGADVNARNKYGSAPLHLGLENDATQEMVATLLDAGADVNAHDQDGKTPLHYAVEIDLTQEVPGEAQELLTMFLDAGADVNAHDSGGYTPLHYAVGFKVTQEVLKILIKARANVNARDQDGKTPLYYAIERNVKQEVFALLLSNGADVNARNKGGTTFLHYAVVFNVTREVLALLLSNGADVNARDTSGNTPLHLLQGGEAQELLTILLDAGANVNARNQKGETFLHRASKVGVTQEVLTILIEAGADVNVRDQDEMLPLHYASLGRSLQHGALIEALLKVSANTSARNKDGKTPLDLFKEGKEEDELKTRKAYWQLWSAELNKRDKIT